MARKITAVPLGAAVFLLALYLPCPQLTRTNFHHTTHTIKAGNHPAKSPIESEFYGALAFSKITDLIYLYILFFHSS